MNAFLLILGLEGEFWLLPLVFSILLGILASAIRQENETKDIQFGKEKLNLSLFTNSLIV